LTVVLLSGCTVTCVNDLPVFDFAPNSYVNQPGFMNAPDLETALRDSVSPVYRDVPDQSYDWREHMDDPQSTTPGRLEFGAPDPGVSSTVDWDAVRRAFPDMDLP
jgi:hypothetical protein